MSYDPVVWACRPLPKLCVDLKETHAVRIGIHLPPSQRDHPAAQLHHIDARQRRNRQQLFQRPPITFSKKAECAAPSPSGAKKRSGPAPESART